MRKHVIKQVLNLRGMTCSNCETRIERALRRIPGVRRVKSSYPRSMV